MTDWVQVFDDEGKVQHPGAAWADASSLSGAASGSAGGDLTGTYPNPTIASGKVTAAKMTSGGALAGQVAMSDGAGGVIWKLSDPGTFIPPTNALFETFPRWLVGTNTTAIVSQTVYLNAIWLPQGATITSISWMSGTTALNAGTHQIFGLYDSSRALLAQTTDDTSTAWAGSTVKTLNLTPSTFTTTYTGLHYVAILVAAGTPVTLMSRLGVQQVNGLAPKLVGTSDTSVNALANPAAALGEIANFLYAYVS